MAPVVVVSQTGRGTGFGRMAASIATALAPAFDPHVLGLGARQADEAWRAHCHDPLDRTRTFGLRALVPPLAPAAVLLLGQGEMAAWQAELLRQDGYAGLIVAYVPLEGDIRQPARLAGLRHCSVLVAYTHTAAAALHQALQSGPPPVPARPLPRIVTIPHAIEQVAPATGPRPALRRQLFPDFAARAAGPWLLNANRNDYRKQPELTLEAFARVVAEVPTATLVMHCALRRPGTDLQITCDELGLRGKVLFSRTAAPWPEATLTQLYRCCNIGINTALGEGWGLVAFEHALHGGAQVLPAHAGLREIWGTAPRWVPVAGQQVVDETFVGQPLAAADLAQALLDLIRRPRQAAQVAQACARHARQARFGWPAVGAAWRELLGTGMG